ncbi:GPI-anchored small secreted protein [Ceratobasidium sp. AG-Ba]|nr:GPI-anchored small secreted protein [Ceratobasidium sp. AG-Ba]
MRFSVAALSLAVAAAAASAFTITKPDSSGWQNGTVTVGWTSAAGDPPVFTIELRDTNTPSVISPLAVANNVNTSAGTHSFELPPVPAANTYQIEFVNVTNINQIYASSATFPIVNRAQAGTTSSVNTVTGTPSSISASPSSTAPTTTTSAAANAALGLGVPSVTAVFFAGLAALL